MSEGSFCFCCHRLRITDTDFLPQEFLCEQWAKQQVLLRPSKKLVFKLWDVLVKIESDKALIMHYSSEPSYLVQRSSSWSFIN